jgi:hypothetical protein
VAGALFSTFACSYPTDDTPYPGQCARMLPVASVPVPNATGVPTDVVFRITFNDYPDPDTVRSDSILLTTGFFWVPGTYGVDLIGKAAVVRPIRDLSPDLGYSLHLRPALASLAGCPGPTEEIEFLTGAGPSGDPPPETPPFAAVQAIFDARCGGGCHLAQDDGGGGCLAPSAAAAGLSLCAADAWDALVSAPSRQTDELRLVQSGESARSYLLRKLLPATADGGRLPRVFGQREPPGPPPARGPVAADCRLDRRRRAAIDGRRRPLRPAKVVK